VDETMKILVSNSPVVTPPPAMEERTAKGQERIKDISLPAGLPSAMEGIADKYGISFVRHGYSFLLATKLLCRQPNNRA